MATKQVAAPAFPFAVFISENSTNQYPTPGALLVSQTSPSAVNITISSGVSSTSAAGTPTVAGSASPTLTGVALYIGCQPAQHRDR